MKVGVLALQGDVREHLRALDTAGATPAEVKTLAALADVEGLVIPGGESTTIGKLLDRFELLSAIQERAKDGMGLFGTCAGLILMAKRITGTQDAPHRVGNLDVTVRRNAYGRQVDSFESDLYVEGIEGSVRAVFIRAPVIEAVGDGVEVLASIDGAPVLVREGRSLASSFHPEITGDDRVHRLFTEMLER